MIADNYHWRRRFTEVVEEVYRQLDFDPPPMTHDQEASLVMELDVEGTKFDVVHNPSLNATCCLIEARLGPVQANAPQVVLIKLLTENYIFSKRYDGCFAADIKDDTILYNLSLPLESLRGAKLLQVMHEISVLASDWRRLLSSMEPADSSAATVSAALA